WFVSDPDLSKNPFGGVDEVRMNPPYGNPALVRPAGPTDPEVSFISVQARDGRPIALLANYSLHYVGGGSPRGEVSANYFGEFVEYLTEHLGAEKLSPPFVGIMSNGTSGDITSGNRKPGAKPDPPELRKPYAKSRFVADQIARRVKEAHQSIK